MPAASKLHSGIQTQARSRNMPYRVGLLIPMSGTAGIWGPSCLASAQVAMQELNRRDGIGGRAVELIPINAAVESEDCISARISDLLCTHEIDGFVGMHISAVRQQVAKALGGRAPFVYTPLYEGGEDTPGVFTIGETPKRQLWPAIAHLTQRFKLKKWALIGNDYVWPRVSHLYAKQQIAALGGDLVYERYLPFSSRDIETTVEHLGQSGADGVLVSLIGQDAIDFNRVFGAMGLHRKIIRLSCALEENGLLAIGAENLDRLFCSASYFSGLPTEENARFREKYYSLHRDRAPTLNAIGQSTYEGMQFLAGLVGNPDESWTQTRRKNVPPISYTSARGGSYVSNSQNCSPVYLARANGMLFEDLKRLC